MPTETMRREAMLDTLQAVKDAVDAGKPVRWENDGYHVTKDCLGQYLVTFRPNGYCVGLTAVDVPGCFVAPTE